MKTIFTTPVLGLFIMVFISSCSTTNEVASHRGIQKRKYTKGFYISKNNPNFNQNIKNSYTKSEIINKETDIDIEYQTLNSNNNSQDNSELIATNINNKNDALIPITNSSIDSKKTNNSNNFVTEEENQITNNIYSNKINDIKNRKKNKKTNQSSGSGTLSLVLLIIIAFLVPPLAVALATQLDIGKTLLCLLLTILFYLPGLIYALIIISKYK